MSKKQTSTALVPAPKLSPPAKIKSSKIETIKIVDDALHIKDKEEVKHYIFSGNVKE